VLIIVVGVLVWPGMVVMRLEVAVNDFGVRVVAALHMNMLGWQQPDPEHAGHC
jgi:hypothetical protein